MSRLRISPSASILFLVALGFFIFFLSVAASASDRPLANMPDEAPSAIMRLCQSPYGNILDAINKNKGQTPSPQQSQSPSGSSTTPSPSQSQIRQPVKPPPPPPEVSFEGKDIKAKLDLTITVKGSTSYSDTKPSNYKGAPPGSSSGQKTVDGKATVSLGFEEMPAFPDMPGPSQKILVPVGRFTYYLDEKGSEKSQWTENEKIIGDYIVLREGTPRGGMVTKRDQSQWSRHCTGTQAYEGGKYRTQSIKPVALPGMDTKQFSQMQPSEIKVLDYTTCLWTEEQPDGTIKYSIDLEAEGECTSTRSSSGNYFQGSSDTDRGTDSFYIEIEGSFQKGQKTVKIGPEDVEYHSFPKKVEISNTPRETQVTIAGTLTFIDKPGALDVSPKDGLASSGPDDNDNFAPASKTYTLKNTGESPIEYTVSKSKKWLDISTTGGTLGPKGTAKVTVTINKKEAEKLKEGTYEDTVTFTNKTDGKGTTSRKVTLEVGEEQTWLVRLTGQETDDVGGKLMFMKIDGKWGPKVVEYGVRFNYKLAAEFTIKKKKGKWTYKKGKITQAEVGLADQFDPEVFFVKKIECRNCSKVKSLAGKSLSGSVNGDKVRLIWPNVITNAVAYNKLKLAHNSKDESHKGYSANEFFSECFFHWTWTHNLPLKNGEVPPFQRKRESSVNKYRQNGKKPIYVYHRYVMKRIK